MMSIAIAAIVAILLTFWTRKLALILLDGMLRGPVLVVLANAASFVFWSIVTAFVHASNLQLVNPAAWLPYFPAQMLWLVLDLVARRPQHVR